jgi:hypothetical protein
LIEAIQFECNKLREQYIPIYLEIGAPGMFAVSMMRLAITKAEKAIADMDVVAMVASLQELREFKL